VKITLYLKSRNFEHVAINVWNNLEYLENFKRRNSSPPMEFEQVTSCVRGGQVDRTFTGVRGAKISALQD